MGEQQLKQDWVSRIRHVILFALKIVVAVAVGFAVLLILVQNSMIYHPTPYREGEVDAYVKSSGVKPLNFATDLGKQEAYWIVRGGAAGEERPVFPDRIWLVFSGNAATALDWVDFLFLYRGPPAGFLLIDYPGYGACEGSPSPDAVQQSTKGAVTALCAHLNCDEVGDVHPKLAVLGQSLGGAAGLQAAVHFKINRVVLISPFTRMLDMARRTAGPLHCHLLRHRWDNVARLEELAKVTQSPRVSILHGTADNIIPVKMSQELVHQFPGIVELKELPGLGHNDITYGDSGSILAAIGQ